MRRCLGCMELIDGQLDRCPLCGYLKESSAQEAYCLDPGTVLQERYLLGKVLGYGGFGITYIGYDNSLQRKVAVKEYLPSDYATRKPGTKAPVVYSGDAQEQYTAGLSSFLGEARNLAGFVSSPGIVDIYDCFEENDTGYIVMEYLKGKTVKELLAGDKKFPYQKAEEIILHVLDGLEIVHREGIIHRDIAPDNIFITDDGEVKLLDFGAARYAASIYSRSLSVILKPGYAPEEQYRSHGQQGPWTDIYGVGATFYRMITGKRPPESLERMEEDNLKRPSELGVEIPPEKEAVLMKSLEVRMENRIQSVEEFREELKKKIPYDSGKDDTEEERRKEEDRRDSGKADEQEKTAAGGRMFVRLGIACCAVGICLAGFYFGKDVTGGNNRTAKTEEGMPAPAFLDTQTEEKETEEKKAEEPKSELETGMNDAAGTADQSESIVQSEAESTAESERLQSEEESKAESERLQSEAESTAQSEKESEEESAAESERLQSEAESTAQSEVKEKKENRKTYQLPISQGEETQKIKLHDKTGLNKPEITILERSEGTESTVYSTTDKKNQNAAKAGADGLYNLKVTGASTEAPLVYYNLNLAKMKELWLEQKEGYAYISYKTKDSDEKIIQDQYSYMTYDSVKTRYILASSLTVRQAPDNINGAAITSYPLGQEIKVCGLAKGLIEGSEGDWYILELDTGYGFISAKDAYSTDDKATADAEVERVEQERRAEEAAEQANNWTSAPAQVQQRYPSGGGGGSSSGGGQIHIVDGGDL